MFPWRQRPLTERGSVVVTFGCGAKVRVDAPAVFTVDGEAEGTLDRGTASAHVPTQAIGFAIHTSLADIVDLGTEFQLHILDRDRLEIHVFDGMVEVKLDDRFNHAKDGPLKLTQGRSTRLDAIENNVITLEYDESLWEGF
jgi:hypothetical protein